MATYSISLDDVDLALLPLRARTHTYNDFLKNEHYQLKRADNDEEQISSILYTCHMCAIEVPAEFARKHVASIKHRANVRIATEAAQRTHALVSALPPPHVEQLNTRFCANCSIKASRHHNKTNKHKDAVMRDKLLWDLMIAYTSNNSDDERIGENSGNSDINDFRDEDNSVDSGHKEYENKLQLKTIEKYNNAQNHNDKVSERIDEVTDTKTDRNHKGLNILSSEPNETIKTNKEYEKELQLKNVEKVDEQNDDKFYKCFDEVTGIEADRNHDANETNEKNEEYEKEFQLKDIEIHIDVQKNDHKVSEHIDEIKVNRETINKRRYPIDVCIKIKDKLERDAKKLNSANFKSREVKCDDFIPDGKKLVKVSSDHYHSFILEKGNVKCEICECTFNCDYAIVLALSASRMLPIIEENVVTKIDGTYSYCLLCKKMIKTTQMNRHLWPFNHKKKYDEACTDKGDILITTEKVLNKESTNVVAEVKITNLTVTENNDKIVDSNQQSVLEANAPGHTRSKTPNCLLPMYPYQIKTQENVAHCIICDCKLPNTSENKRVHLFGAKHMRNVRRILPSYPYEDTENEMIVRCVVCDCKVPNNLDNRRDF